MCPEPTWMFNVLDASHTEETLYRQEPHSSTPTRPIVRAVRWDFSRSLRCFRDRSQHRSEHRPHLGPGAQPRAGATAAHRVAGALTLLEGLVLVGFVVFYVVEMVSGATDDLTRAAVSAVLILVFAVASARPRARLVRAPTTGPGRRPCCGTPCCCPWPGRCARVTAVPIALAVGAVALASIVAALAAPRAPTRRARPAR